MNNIEIITDPSTGQEFALRDGVLNTVFHVDDSTVLSPCSPKLTSSVAVVAMIALAAAEQKQKERVVVLTADKPAEIRQLKMWIAADDMPTLFTEAQYQALSEEIYTSACALIDMHVDAATKEPVKERQFTDQELAMWTRLWSRFNNPLAVQ